jgi:NADH-quinone oxidoreductase subunit A
MIPSISIFLAQSGSMQSTAGPSPVSHWWPVVILLVIGIGFAVVNIAASLFIGPSRTGPGKETTYESGMIPVGDTHQRFNVRFYIVAMIFLVFDVEIVFFYPWASIFAKHVQDSSMNGSQEGLILLMEMVVFVAILLVAYFYAWGKGVFRWD